MMTLRRLAVVGVLLATVVGAIWLVLVADEPPDNASVADFCAAYEIPLGADSDYAGLSVQEAAGKWAGRLRDVGTPRGIPSEARTGFEERIGWADSASEATSGDDPKLAMTPSELRRMRTFEEYAETTCGPEARRSFPRLDWATLEPAIGRGVPDVLLSAAEWLANLNARGLLDPFASRRLSAVGWSNAGVNDKMERMRQQLAEGNLLAESFIGMTRDEATARATELGFQPEWVPITADTVTTDLRLNRVRLFLDEDDRVVRAWAG